MEEKSTTIVVTFNREAILHFLRYVRGVYSTTHYEAGEEYKLYKCPYCITLLTQLKKALGDIEIKDKIDLQRSFITNRIKWRNYAKKNIKK